MMRELQIWNRGHEDRPRKGPGCTQQEELGPQIVGRVGVVGDLARRGCVGDGADHGGEVPSE
eukprot:2222369-Rhodomonas_salina.2